MELSQKDIDRLNEMRLQMSIDPSMLLSDTPVSRIEPINPVDMDEAFGGPLYQMMNPSGRKIVDALGLRGEGIGGFLEAMALGPSKAKAVGKGIASLPMNEKLMGKVFEIDKSKLSPQETVDALVKKHRNITDSMNSHYRVPYYDNPKDFELQSDQLREIEEQLKKYAVFKKDRYGDHITEIFPTYYGVGRAINAKLQKVIEKASLFPAKEFIGKSSLIEKARETSPVSANIIKELGKYVDSPGADNFGDPYFIAKMMESSSVKKGFRDIDYDLSKGRKLVSDTGVFPNAITRYKNIAESTSRNVPAKNTAFIGTEDKPFFVDTKKLADKITMSGSGADFFKVRGTEILTDPQSERLTQNILSQGYLKRPIDIEITPLGYAHLSEGNHRMAKALAEGYEEIPVIFRYVAGAERVNHDFAINKLDKFLAPGKKGFKTKKEFDEFAQGIYNQAMTKENEQLAKGLINTQKARTAISKQSDIQAQIDELKMLYNDQRVKFFRAKDVFESAVRDGYNPDIVGSEKIMKNANEYGKELMSQIKKLEAQL